MDRAADLVQVTNDPGLTAITELHLPDHGRTLTGGPRRIPHTRLSPPAQRTPVMRKSENQQHRDHPGAGLGLYFVKKLIKEQGGHVWANE